MQDASNTFDSKSDMNRDEGRISPIWIRDSIFLLCVAHSAVSSMGEDKRLELPVHFVLAPTWLLY